MDMVRPPDFAMPHRNVGTGRLDDVRRSGGRMSCRGFAIAIPGDVNLDRLEARPKRTAAS
jgi:hypothetical protein